jgi:hypothetical protein
MSKPVVTALQAAKKAFSRVPAHLGADGVSKPFTKPFMIHGDGEFTFLGIHQALQDEAHYESARNFFAEKLRKSGAAHSSKPKFNQLIGDSASFDEEGSTVRSLAFYKMFKELADKGDHWLYGFTAHNESDGRMDANGAVGKYLAEHPKQAERFIGNVVCEHTPIALEKWGCSFAKGVKNFLLVYSEKGAKFGDDTIASDSLTDGIVLMGEGGVQSFRQASYMLARDIPVIGVANLRGAKNPATRDPKSGEHLSYFSAAEFLNIVKSATGGGKSLSLKEALEIKENYFASHVPANPNRPDFATKKSLLEEAFKQFAAEEVWTKVDGYKACAFDGEKIVEVGSGGKAPGSNVVPSDHASLAVGDPRRRSQKSVSST